MASGDITHVNVDGVLLTNSYVTMYTVPAGKQAIFVEVVICNIDTTTPYGAFVEFTPVGQAESATWRVIANQAGNYLLPGETQVHKYTPMMDAGDYIQAVGSTTNKISFRAGITLKEV